LAAAAVLPQLLPPLPLRADAEAMKTLAATAMVGAKKTIN
jgi:hypothetical protein